MLKEAIEKIVALANPEVMSICGRDYVITKDGDIDEIRVRYDFPGTIGLNSLDALVKMVKTEALVRWGGPLYIGIHSNGSVTCFAQPADEERRYTRVTFYDVAATDVPGWDAKVQMGFEEAVIALQTRFQKTPDTEYAMRLLSEITNGSKVTFNDNGIAQTVVTQKGIAMQGVDKIKPILELKPFRTFQEVEQPTSKFLIRISDRGISFIEADGGMWKLEARKIIKAYLEEQFSAEIETGSVVVML